MLCFLILIYFSLWDVDSIGPSVKYHLSMAVLDLQVEFGEKKIRH